MGSMVEPPEESNYYANTTTARKKKKSCLQSAKQHGDNPHNFWNKIVLSDEIKIELFDQSHNGLYTIPTVQH